MARETNFVDLYRLLNVRPGCDIAEFKAAYRRRVAVLHPDRRGVSQEDLIASERLQQLTTLYSAAMDFKRRHGRLPGALFTPLPNVAAVEPVARESAIAPGHALRWLLVVLTLVLGTFWLVWNPDWFSDAAESNSSVEIAASATPETDIKTPLPASFDSIEIGTATDAVRTIEGEPMIIGDSRWDYGPSWIRFENGKVVDWYSSPLHPLKTPSSHPQTVDN